MVPAGGWKILLRLFRRRPLVFLLGTWIVFLGGAWHLLGTTGKTDVSAVLVIRPSGNAAIDREGIPLLLTRALDDIRSPSAIQQVLLDRHLPGSPRQWLAGLEIMPQTQTTPQLRLRLTGKDTEATLGLTQGLLDRLTTHSASAAREFTGERVLACDRQIASLAQEIQLVQAHIKRLREKQRLFTLPGEVTRLEERLDKHRREATTLSGARTAARLNLRQAQKASLSRVVRRIPQGKGRKPLVVVQPPDPKATAARNARILRLEKQVRTIENRQEALQNLILQEEKELLVFSDRLHEFQLVSSQKERMESELAAQRRERDELLLAGQVGFGNLVAASGPLVNHAGNLSPMGLDWPLLLLFSVGGGVFLCWLLDVTDPTVQAPLSGDRLFGLALQGRILDLAQAALVPAGEPLPVDPALYALLAPNSLPTETCRRLRNRLLEHHRSHPFRSLALLSPSEGVGASVLAANLAILLARSGLRVLLVDADLRRPAIHLLFGADNLHGFTSLLGGSPVIETALPSPVPGLRIIPSGPLPPDPVETMRNERLTRVLRDLSEETDFVIFDTSPLQLSGDALLLVPRLDRVFLLAGAGYSNRTEIETCLDALQEQDIPLSGIILNRLATGDIWGMAAPEPADPPATADRESA